MTRRGFKVRTLHKHFLTRFGWRGKNRTTTHVSDSGDDSGGNGRDGDKGISYRCAIGEGIAAELLKDIQVETAALRNIFSSPTSTPGQVT